MYALNYGVISGRHTFTDCV